jgi:lambda repressor-like predicted transcriptional regulator
MTAWEYCKTQGVTMKQLSTVTEQSLETLKNWYQNPKKRKVFELVIKGMDK